MLIAQLQCNVFFFGAIFADKIFQQLTQINLVLLLSDSVFLVQVPKGTRGLGLSVSGGSDSSAPFPGLIRIKRLFPHQAAWATGMLQPGDILLEANGIPLTGLTNYVSSLELVFFSF